MSRPRSQLSPSPVSKADLSPAAYHHGDLRRAIIEAAVALLAEQKHWDFSLREVARRAGVSHNAPYNHFADKQALLVAVATVGFESLREQMQRRAARTAEPSEALVAIGTAYVRFGVSHPAQYRLMFGLALATEAGGLPPAMAESADASKAVLAEVIRRGAQSGEFAVSAADPVALELAILSAWSLVHGLTMLAIDGLAGKAGALPSGAQNLAEHTARTFLAGLRQR